MNFRFFEVVGVKASFGLGFTLKLSPDQAKSRAANLKPLGNDSYDVLSPVEFKKGEKVGVAENHPGVNKAMLLDLTEMEDRDRKRREREIKAQAEAQATVKQPGLLDRARAAIGLGGSSDGATPAGAGEDKAHENPPAGGDDEAPV
ncbi:MAG: hypothetical protein HQL44_17215 [Alphaproteobacteria bacterium]|nr:hypothetical protein [Alphaproteobacteria bacterium]